MSMNERYEPQELEPRWQERWHKEGAFTAGKKPNAPKKYILEMLPYPSGKMHMGHVRNYLIGDIYARYYQMKGFDVLHPFGWDAFGLPAENAAIKDGVHPAVRTQENIASFKAEVISLGHSYDWGTELSTAEPEYYRWNQWFFLQMLEKGLVYRRFSKVNWCNGFCQTVIANEQVKEGRCERCDGPVVDKEMPEWAFRITRYSDELLQGLDQLGAWPERITAMQRNWIGRSEGVEADFAVEGHQGITLRVFTTRIDTVFGCTYVVVAPDHKAVARFVAPERRATIEAFAADIAQRKKEDKGAVGAAKEGLFTGAYARNPFTGEKVPIWVANFVVADYGTGAVMSVPAHDERDFEFAKKYQLPIKTVIHPNGGQKLPAGDALEKAFTDDGVLDASGAFSGLSSADARAKMGAELEKKGLGQRTITYRQRDWGLSRQRYWGTPIPIVYCEKCDPKHEGLPVPLDQLPVRLPDIETQAVLTGKGEPPLAKIPSFVSTTCPKCAGPARREVETMDTFVDSSWYYARYVTPHFDQLPFDPKVVERWLPVDVYVGGPEHATMHLLYFRFWCRVMKLLGLVKVDEPVTRLITQGIVNGPDGRKMSKRWGNVVAPATIVKKYGADTARVYVAFAGPPERDFNWSDEQVEGAHRFLKRVWAIAYQHQGAFGAPLPQDAKGKAMDLRRASHRAVKRVTEAIERLSFNTAVAACMEFVNSLYAAEKLATPEEKGAMNEALGLLALLLTPFAPHLADELWAATGHAGLCVRQAWPTYDPALAADELASYAVQVNGKLRAEVKVAVDADEAVVRAAAEAEEKVKQALAGKQLRKVIFVPKRLVNFVVG